MTLVLNGTTGVSAVDGSAGTPAIQGNDTNTGVFFPAADTVAIATGGTERVRTDSAGNVGIGSTPVNSRRLTVTTSGQTDFSIVAGSGNYGQLLFGYTGADNKGIVAYNNSDNSMQFYTNGTERARIDSSGQLYLGTAGANTPSSTRTGTAWGFGSGSNNYWINAVNSTGTANHWSFVNGNGEVGKITTNGSATTYATSSDYRLKEDIAP